MYITVASEAHKYWGGHSQYGNKKWGGSAAAKAASAAAAPTPMYKALS